MAKPPKRTTLDAIAEALPDFEQAQAMTLRQLGARDPLSGAPLRWQQGREPDDIVEILPGRWLDEGWCDTNKLPVGCPVIPLGKDGDVCWFLDTMGAVFSLDAKSSGKGPIGYMFGGRSRYLEWAWPRWSGGKTLRRAIKDEDGATVGHETIVIAPKVIGWDADNARQALVDACAFVGHFALEDQVRGRGAWRADDDGLIYHAGDEVWIDGAWRPCGMHGRFIYPSRPNKIGRPSLRAQKAGPGSPGDYMLEILRTFNWDRGELDARLMLGWLVTAKIGGALDHRPVAFITGGEGSGKSTLHKHVLRASMNGALIATSDTTQAGIYQRLQQDSIAILVDEFESREDNRVNDKILSLVRIAYSGDKMQRGGKDGVGKEFALMSSFLGSAISKPATDAQDDSRMCQLMLRERESAGGKLETSFNELEALGRHLLRRVFDWWPRWGELLGVFRKALIEVGHNDRACDTFGPLAAGAHLALSDEMPTEAELAEWMEWLRADQLAETSSREKTWRRCLTHILDAQPDLFRTRLYKSIGSVLDAWRHKPHLLPDVEEYLPQVGLSVSWPKEEPLREYENARLFVPAKHPALHNLFAGTPWPGRPAAPGPWLGVLRQMPRELWHNGKSEKGLDRKASGLFIRLKDALEA